MYRFNYFDKSDIIEAPHEIVNETFDLLVLTF